MGNVTSNATVVIPMETTLQINNSLPVQHFQSIISLKLHWLHFQDVQKYVIASEKKMFAFVTQHYQHNI